MPFTTLGVNEVLAGVIANDLYLALVWNLPSDDDTGSTISEVTGTGYTRKTLSAASWSAPVEGVATYDANISWSVSVTWDQTIVGYAICSAASGGDLVAYEYFGYPVRVTVQSGSTSTTLTIPSGSLSIEVS